MANCEKLIPTIIKWEAGVDPKKEENIGLTNRELFEKARKNGYGNDPVDSGGPTMVGIILETYKAYCKSKGKRTPTINDLKEMPYEEWFEIFKTRFWDKMLADQINNQSIANLCVNTVWGTGPGYIKIIQCVLGVKQDGVVGPITLAAINNYPSQKILFEKLWLRRKKFFEDIVESSVKAYERKRGRKATERELLKYTKKRFLKGWLNRLNDFQFSE